MHVSKITAEAFNASIEKALNNIPDAECSIKKIQKTLNSLPNGKVFTSIRDGNAYFYTVVDGKQRYISKKSNLLYSLLRRRYLTCLMNILQLSNSRTVKDQKRRRAMICNVQKLIQICETGNLDIARIVLTNHQYKWFTGFFKQKPVDPNTPFKSAGGLPLRSKSERDIANANETFAVPFHYEEQLVIFVKPIVVGLLEELRNEGKLRGKLFTYTNGTIHWIVPEELQWMNSHGSIWKTYDSQKGTITIYSDFKVMFADDTLFFWEHSGLMASFLYRCNASERTAVMKYTKTVDDGHLLETYENDIDTKEKTEDIIERHILPYLWF